MGAYCTPGTPGTGIHWGLPTRTTEIGNPSARAGLPVIATDVPGCRDVVIDGETVNEGFKKAAGNLPGVNVLPAIGANVYDILNHDTLVLTKDAVAKLEARFNG